MADNSNAQAVLVANTKIRPASDMLAKLYNQCKSLQNQYTAENWAILFPATADNIADGSVIDGRTIITNQDVLNIFSVISAYISFMEATSNQKLTQVLKVSVNS